MERRQLGRGGAPVRRLEAERLIAAPRERVFAFLAHLPNHWRLEDALTELEATSETTARVRLNGPLGVARVAETRVVEAVEPERLRGAAEVGARTRARVAWDLEARGDATHVRLSSEMERVSLVDRLVLVLGGRAWLRRVYARALANLERELSK